VKYKNYVYLLVVFLLYVQQTFCQTKVEKTPPITRILFILDASGSMSDKWERSTRMTVAKKTLCELVDSLKNIPYLEIGLRVYGHEWDKRYNNCKDTKLEVPFRPGNHDAIKMRIKNIEPKGTTLIAHSLKEAASDFPIDKNSRNVIILLTDGIESCGGDPCDLSRELQKRKIFLKPFIIGIGNDVSWDKAFECMGQYFNAINENKFKNMMNLILHQTLSETSVKVKILDIDNKPTETNVNITFFNSVTGEPVYDFVHYLDDKGEPDKLKVDAILTYDLVVNTIPRVEKKNIGLIGGKENIITIKAPQGSLFIRENSREYKALKAVVRESKKTETLNIQNTGIKEKYLVGTYDIEVLTLPRTIFTDVKIKQSETTVLDIVQPGSLNIIDQLVGYGSIYEIKPNGEQVLIHNLENETSRAMLTMQPGNYKLIFRTKKSNGANFTDVQNFSIRSGATTTLRLYNNK
jgi:Ca-activated chloride channel family protein